MRVLLINSNRFKHPWPVIPFGICHVAAAVEEAGHPVQVLDLCFSEDCEGDIRRSIESFEPELLGISVRNIDNGVGYETSFLLDEIRDEVIAPCKRHFAGTIVLGGSAIGINGVEILSYFDLEYGLRGDGEHGIVEFISRLERSESPVGVGGLIIRKDGKTIQEASTASDVDINDVPHARPHHYLDLKPYLDLGSPLQIQTKRGCALHCAYCIYNVIEGRRYRLRDPQSIVREIEQLVQATGSRHIEFVDSTFNIPLDHCKKVLRAIIGSGLKLKLRAMGLNPSAVDDELVELLRQAGFVDVDLGVESGCDVTLRSLGKNFTKAQVLEAGRRLRGKGISITWFLLLGSLDESRETLRETFDTIVRAAARFDLIIISIGLRVYNNSPMANRLRSENRIDPPDNFLHPVCAEPEKLDVAAIRLLTKHEAMRRPNFYLYGEHDKVHLGFLRLGNTILKWIAPGQPVWKWFVFLNTIQALLGIRFVRRRLFESRHREQLQEIDRRTSAMPLGGSPLHARSGNGA